MYRLLAARAALALGDFGAADQLANAVLGHAEQGSEAAASAGREWQREWARLIQAEAVWRGRDMRRGRQMLEELAENGKTPQVRGQARRLLGGPASEAPARNEE